MRATMFRREWLAEVPGKAQALGDRVPGGPLLVAALERDRRRGGGLLAGALAFRLFAAMLPLALLTAVALGYASTLEEDSAATVADTVGVRRALLESFAESARLSSGTRWTVVAAGLVALLWSATSAARAIRTAHVLAWDGGVSRFARPVHAGLVLILAVAAFALVWGAMGWARANLGVAGLVIALAAIVPFFAIWLGVAYLLPHGGAPWTALAPGALLVAIGMQVVHLGTVLFMAGRVERASATYGSFGAALTILVWLFVVSRVIVASAMLDAVVWERRRPREVVRA